MRPPRRPKKNYGDVRTPNLSGEIALGSFVRGLGEGIPKMFSHYGDIRREAWLACLQAAATLHATTSDHSVERVVAFADKFFAAAKERYSELADPLPAPTTNPLEDPK